MPEIVKTYDLRQPTVKTVFGPALTQTIVAAPIIPGDGALVINAGTERDKSVRDHKKSAKGKKSRVDD